jgi:hypothetical protein
MIEKRAVAEASFRCRLAGVWATRFGNRRHSAARGETTGCWPASRRASDSQPRGRSHSAVWCPARRRCALATRFRQWSVQRPSTTISNRKAQRSIRSRRDRDRSCPNCSGFATQQPAARSRMPRVRGRCRMRAIIKMVGISASFRRERDVAFRQGRSHKRVPRRRPRGRRIGCHLRAQSRIGKTLGSCPWLWCHTHRRCRSED